MKSAPRAVLDEESKKDRENLDLSLQALELRKPSQPMVFRFAVFVMVYGAYVSHRIKHLFAPSVPRVTP